MAEPQRLRRSYLAAAEISRQVPPRVFFPARRIVAKRQPHQTLAELRVDVIGLDRLRELETADGFLMAVEAAQRQTEVVVGIGVVGPEGQRLLVACNGFVIALERLQGDAHVAV